ncbi:MAG TPA: glycosyltransferase, partial [Burkholderiales bacterium]|nr:glycosyltransferase [Burkholderiales bacterium]
PTLNSARFVKACVENVHAQEGILEHVIVDGGSSDGTIEAVEALRRVHPHVRLIRGPDRGQSDALNKATLASRGDVIGVLNVDDFYEPGAAASALACLREMKAPGIVVGDCKVIDEHGAIRFWNRPVDLRAQALLLGWSYAPFPCNPSAYFYHREVHSIVGGYDVDDHHAMDFDFILSCAQRVETRYVPAHWGNFRLMPGCKTYDDDQGPLRVAKIIARHRSRMTRMQRLGIRVAKSRIDFHRFRTSWGLR